MSHGLKVIFSIKVEVARKMEKASVISMWEVMLFNLSDPMLTRYKPRQPGLSRTK